MRTLTAYGVAVVLVLAVVNLVGWSVGSPHLRGLGIFSVGFVLGAVGMYLSAWVNGYRKAEIH